PRVVRNLAEVAVRGGCRLWRPRSAKRGVRRLVGWWPAKRCAEKAALFTLLIGVGFQPFGAAGQTRCDVAAGRIVSAEGEVTVAGPAGALLQPVAAGAEVGLCPGETVLVGPRSRAAIRLQDTGQVIRLDQGTTLRVLPPRQPSRPLLDLSRGVIQ